MKKINILKKFKSILNSIIFVFTNVKSGLKLSSMPNKLSNGIFFRGVRSKQDRQFVYDLYGLFYPEKKLHWSKKVIYWFAGSKLLMTAWDEKESMILGINIYYFNQRDIQEHSIHEGFIGVYPEWQGKRIATNMRRLALSHFSANGLDAVSSRVSLSNIASLKSNQNLGFKPVEKYFDEKMNEERYYLKCDLSQYRKRQSNE
jgi:RimJ/RimL family protein N-acetyltransferase